jgi:hypothetical protein
VIQTYAIQKIFATRQIFFFTYFFFFKKKIKMAEKTKVFVVECRTDGRFGAFIWISAVVADKKAPVDNLYFNGIVNFTKFIVTGDSTCSNIVPYASECLLLEENDLRRPTVYHYPVDLMNAFWEFYVDNCKDCDIVSDYITAGPSRLFASCIGLDETHRKHHIPVPLLDLSSVSNQMGYSDNMDKEAFMTSFKCSLVPKNWTEKSIDPMYAAMRILSVFVFLVDDPTTRKTLFTPFVWSPN